MMGNDMSSESAPHSRTSTYEWVGHPPSFHQPTGAAASSPPQPIAAPRGLQYPPLTDLHRAPAPAPAPAPAGHKSPPPGTFPQTASHPPLIDLAEPTVRERPPIPSRPAVVPVSMWDTLAPAAALAKLREPEQPAPRPIVPQVEEPDLLLVETELTRAETDLSAARAAPLPGLRIDTTARSPSPEVPSVPDVAENVDLASPMLSGPFSPYPTVEKERSISTVSVAGSATAAPRKGTSTAAEPATSTTSSRSPSPPSTAAAVPITGSVLGLTPAAPAAVAEPAAVTTPPRSPTRDIAARQADLADRLFHLTAQRDRDRAESDRVHREMLAASRVVHSGVPYDEHGYVERRFMPDRLSSARMQPYARYVMPDTVYTFTQQDGDRDWEISAGGGRMREVREEELEGLRTRPWSAYTVR
ncbi:hypothetical protein AMAG_12913 [Allomyces macrogynus ATCC 38327]|uniref:Uncharacterized protein n=1 Tax=Allomyces macrogynus (strain ATCC 38327) TaxID=578462 RepID=A0A0L0T0C6_ALLM3|nr:hypothetical protein AMAG_12913 [Allomyces macrogynus ATCC 38327]|eukprot:KNE68238.1 hypothetical protein AMAG_12913 [Allomyces macrogynus ATCC 38327]